MSDSVFVAGLCSGDFKRMHRYGGHSMQLRPESCQAWVRAAFVRTYIFVHVFYRPLPYRRPWSVHLSDKIFVAVIWFAIPVTAVPRVTDGIYMCSTFKRLEVDPLLWSWKFFFQTWNILISSKDIYLGAQLPSKTGNGWAECKYTSCVFLIVNYGGHRPWLIVVLWKKLLLSLD